MPPHRSMTARRSEQERSEPAVRRGLVREVRYSINILKDWCKLSNWAKEADSTHAKLSEHGETPQAETSLVDLPCLAWGTLRTRGPRSP